MKTGRILAILVAGTTVALIVVGTLCGLIHPQSPLPVGTACCVLLLPRSSSREPGAEHWPPGLGQRVLQSQQQG